MKVILVRGCAEFKKDCDEFHMNVLAISKKIDQRGLMFLPGCARSALCSGFYMFRMFRMSLHVLTCPYMSLHEFTRFRHRFGFRISEISRPCGTPHARGPKITNPLTHYFRNKSALEVPVTAMWTAELSTPSFPKGPLQNQVSEAILASLRIVDLGRTAGSPGTRTAAEKLASAAQRSWTRNRSAPGSLYVSSRKPNLLVRPPRLARRS